MQKKAEFWITNVSKMNVTLSDLSLVVPAKRSWNLLDSKHFSYSLEQLEKSAAAGSIFKKSDKIKVRNIPPTEPIKPGIYVAVDDFRKVMPRSLVKIEQKKYEELEFDMDSREAEEKQAAEFAELEENMNKKSGK